STSWAFRRTCTSRTRADAPCRCSQTASPSPSWCESAANRQLTLPVRRLSIHVEKPRRVHDRMTERRQCLLGGQLSQSRQGFQRESLLFFLRQATQGDQIDALDLSRCIVADLPTNSLSEGVGQLLHHAV